MFGNENGTPREQMGVPWVFVFSHEKNVDVTEEPLLCA